MTVGLLLTAAWTPKVALLVGETEGETGEGLTELVKEEEALLVGEGEMGDAEAEAVGVALGVMLGVGKGEIGDAEGDKVSVASMDREAVTDAMVEGLALVVAEKLGVTERDLMLAALQSTAINSFWPESPTRGR